MNILGWLLRRKRRFATESATQGSSVRVPITHPGYGAAFAEKVSDRDRTFAVKREPVASRVVFTVAHDIFDNWFEVEDLAEKPDENLNRNVQTVLVDLKAKEVFTQMAVFERAYGWAVIVVGYEDQGETLADPVENGQKIYDLWAYAPTDITSIKEDRNQESRRYGFPQFYYIKKAGMARRLKIHYSRVLHFASRLLDHPYKGLSVLEPVWDDAGTWRNIRWGLGQTLYRYGSGFPDITIEGASKKKIEDFVAAEEFQNIHARTYFVHDDKKSLEFKGVQGAVLNPEPYCKPIMESLSCGSTIPLSILRGAQAGALTGSEVNEREYFKIISDAQSDYEWGLRFLIEKLMEFGQVKDVREKKDFEIEWLGGFEINERDKRAAEYDVARTRVLQTNYMTVNEVRAIDGLDPVDQGDVVLGLTKVQNVSQFLGGGKETERYTREK